MHQHESTVSHVLRAGFVLAAAEGGGLLSRLAGAYRDMTDAQSRVICAAASLLALAMPGLYRLSLAAMHRHRLAARLRELEARHGVDERTIEDLKTRLQMKPGPGA